MIKNNGLWFFATALYFCCVQGEFVLQMLLLGVLSMGSSLLQAVTGFGFGIIMMATMPLFLPYELALNISTSLSLLLNLTILVRCWRHIQWRQLAFPALFCVLGSSTGMFLMSASPSPIYKRLLGVFLVLLAIWLLFFSDKVHIQPRMRNAAIVGIISGLCGGLFSVSGPPMILYFVSVLQDKEEYMATSQMYFLINNIYLLVMRSLLHLIPDGILLPALCGLAGLVVGSLVGGRIFSSIDTKKMKSVVYVVMALSGLWIAITG